MQFRPMLATAVDPSTVTYPVMASYKLDGVRAMVIDGRLMSRTLKPIPNLYLQEQLGKPEYNGLDGELVDLVNPEYVDPDCYRNTVSKVMTASDEAFGVAWKVFDNFTHRDEPFAVRWQTVPSHVRLHQQLINNTEELLKYEDEALRKGYEGLIIRDPYAPYKCGRSTAREGWMLKIKRYSDDEAMVVDFEELMHNANPAELDERGYTKHSHHQANKVPMNKLGALVTKWRGHILHIGTGFTDQERTAVWNNRDAYKGEVVKFKYLKTGMKDLPRHPVFLGWRHPIDAGG